MEQVEDPRRAPLSLMSQFLVCVAEKRMSTALELCEEILAIEPDNELICEYKKTLRAYIVQERQEEEKKNGEATESEAESGESSDDSEEEGSSGSSSGGESEEDHDAAINGREEKYSEEWQESKSHK